MNAAQTDTTMKEKIIMQTKEIISSMYQRCMVHKTVHRLCCYMNIPMYSKLFIQIVRKTSVREVIVRESDCPGKVLSPKLEACMGEDILPVTALSRNAANLPPPHWP